MTTLRGGTRPRCSTTSGPVTSRIAVDAVSTTPAPMHGLALDAHALDDDDARADEAPSSTITGARAGRLEHAADADAARRGGTSRPICAHEPTVAQVSTIVPAPTRAPMLT